MLRLALAAALLVPSVARAEPPDAKKVEFFETKIRPVLVEQCLKCHSEDAARDKKLKGGLKLDTKAATLAGGDSGAAVVPGKPSEGTLLASLKYNGDLQMPPKGKLPDAVVKDFETWIADGAIDPRTGEAAKAAGIDVETGKQFWAFQPPKEPNVPAVPFNRDAQRSANPIDAFIQAKWAEKGAYAGGPGASAARSSAARATTSPGCRRRPTRSRRSSTTGRPTPSRRWSIQPARVARTTARSGPALARRGPVRRGPGAHVRGEARRRRRGGTATGWSPRSTPTCPTTAS
jgi:hypothetical protein